MDHLKILITFFLSIVIKVMSQEEEEREVVISEQEDIVQEHFLYSRDFRVRIYIKICLFKFYTLQSILIVIVGFWGGVFVMGTVYLLMVLAKRTLKPEEAVKSPVSYEKLTFACLNRGGGGGRTENAYLLI